jgi:hypothetical protein
MKLWHASNDLHLTAGGLAASAVAKNLRLEAEAGREATELGLGLSYRGQLDTSG